MYLWVLYQRIFFAVLSTCNSVSRHWRTVGQKNIWTITSFVYQRQRSAFGRAISALLPHSHLKSCRKNKLFPFELILTWGSAASFLVCGSFLVLNGLSWSSVVIYLTFPFPEEKKKLVREFDEKQREANETVSVGLVAFLRAKCSFFMDPILAGRSLSFLLFENWSDRCVCVC